MSHWVRLNDANGDCVRVEHHREGGTYAMCGTDEAELNVTYNYGAHIHTHIEGGLRSLNGKRAGDWVKPLRAAVAALGTDRDENYWAPTEGNAGYALSILLSWAEVHPDAIFEVY